MNMLANTPQRIDLNARHVVFVGDDGKALFSQVSSNYHAAKRVLRYCRNFEEANRFVKNLNKSE